MLYNEILKEFNLFSIPNRRLTGNLIMVYKYIHREKLSDSSGLFKLAVKYPMAEN